MKSSSVVLNGVVLILIIIWPKCVQDLESFITGFRLNPFCPRLKTVLIALTMWNAGAIPSAVIAFISEYFRCEWLFSRNIELGVVTKLPFITFACDLHVYQIFYHSYVRDL